jgi:hypothetical protein
LRRRSLPGGTGPRARFLAKIGIEISRIGYKSDEACGAMPTTEAESSLEILSALSGVHGADGMETTSTQKVLQLVVVLTKRKTFEKS